MSEITHAVVIENKQIAQDTFDLRIHSPAQAAKAKAGQFLGIYTGNPAMLLPRPLSICEIDKPNGILRVIYRIVGGGTKEIAEVAAGEKLRILGPLGNGYDIDTNYRDIAIVGGGLGVPPLLQLASSIRKIKPSANIAIYLGFRDKSQVILEEEFSRYDDKVTVCTDDGSYGVQGNAIAALPQKPVFDAVYGCGPKPMLAALAKYAEAAGLPCFVSVEEHMACCVGTCLACAVKAYQDGGTVNKRACYDGPVFNAKELVWE
ncbi:MAG: dihydroorotate dehydrogenase electron transfer subunit [Defluviitaleaceae bacterium]|nr:dihydroorotate dehydrogenase electron transfer subunit [Defluviitaleaceae bacterium]